MDTFAGSLKRTVTRFIAIFVVAGMAIVSSVAGVGVASAGATTAARTSFPAACPTAALVSSKLGHKVTKTVSAKVAAGGERAVPTIVFVTPVTRAKFTAAHQ